MNCARFQDLLFEYLDGELSPDEQALAAEHLVGCAECRSFLERENRVAKAFQERTIGLKLSAGFERRVLEAVEAPAAAVGTFEGFLAFARRFAWIATMGAAAVVLAAVVLFQGHWQRDAGRPVSVEGGVERVQATFVSGVYTFRQEGDRVVDLLEYRTNHVDGVVLLSRN